MWDAAFRQQLLDGLVELGYAVESAFNDTPQDIEGVWLGGRFAVVQSRPQVGAMIHSASQRSCCSLLSVRWATGEGTVEGDVLGRSLGAHRSLVLHESCAACSR